MVLSNQIKIHTKIIASIFGLLLGFATFAGINMTYGQIGTTGTSEYDKECGTNIPNNGKAKEMLTTYHNLFGPNVEDFPPASKELYTCINTIYEQETGNDIKTQLEDQYDCKDPIDCLSESMLRDQRDGGIDDDGDGEGSDDKDDNNPNVQ